MPIQAMYTLTRKLRVVNKSGKPQSYKVTPTLRYQDDADTGRSAIAVEPVDHRAVPARSTRGAR